MIFVDYYIDKIGQNILFDPELSPSKFGVQDGDVFIVRIVNDRIAFIRADTEEADPDGTNS